VTLSSVSRVKYSNQTFCVVGSRLDLQCRVTSEKLLLMMAEQCCCSNRVNFRAVVLNLFHCWDPLNATDVVWDPQVKIEKVCAPE